MTTWFFQKSAKQLFFAFLFLIFAISFFITKAYSQYLCGSTGLVYSDPNFCSYACGGSCQQLVSTSNGTSYQCPSSGYEGFVYNPNTGYTYAVTTNTGFWTSFNSSSNDPSLAIIPDSTTNTALSQILSYYSISNAWIGAYDPSMSTSYNITDPQNYVWWNNSAINYSNWASNQPYNLLDSQDVGLVSIQGNHWAYMSSNGAWSADGYHYNYPSSQNYAPYYNALVQWNGPLSCVNGVAPSSSSVTNTDITNTVNQYCNGTSPCYMCTDTSQCTPQNECLSGYTYNSTNNDCEAPATCPSGGTLDASNNTCTATANVACPNNYTFNSTNNDCESSPNPSCNDSGTISGGQCVLAPSNGCPAYYSYNSTNNDCEANPSPQCSNGGTAELVSGQNMCVMSPSYTCPDSSYEYNTLVSLQCAAQPNVSCPAGGSPTTGNVNCLSTTTPCPTGYTLNGSGQCTAPITITCPGSGTYNETYGDCLETPQAVCSSGFSYNSSISACDQTPPSYSCPGSGSYNSSEGMCSTPVVLGCPTGYTLSGSQCVAPVSNSCPLPGTFNSSENACSASVTSYNCPSGYTYANNMCEASPSCPDSGTLIPNGVCSTPLQPCSPTTQDMQQCTDTASGWLCPLDSALCIAQSSSDFTSGGVVTPGTYNNGTWSGISITGNNNVNNGYMSFYAYNTNLPAGTYTLNFNADDDGWLYINGSLIGTGSTSYTSNGGYANIFIAVMNSCPGCAVGGNPTGTGLSVVNSSGSTVLTTSTSWQASLNPSNFGYTATCPSGYVWNQSANACTATATPNCVSGYTYVTNNNDCEAPATCPSGGSISGSQCVATPSCSNGGAFNGNVCVLAVSSYSCPSGGTYNGSQCVATPQCPSGYTFNSSADNCQMAATINCPSGYTYNSSTQQCDMSPSCPSGTSFNSSLEECVASATCPSGGSISGSQCVAPGGVTCPNGGTLSGTTCSYAATANTQSASCTQQVLYNTTGTSQTCNGGCNGINVSNGQIQAFQSGLNGENYGGWISLTSGGTSQACATGMILVCNTIDISSGSIRIDTTLSTSTGYGNWISINSGGTSTASGGVISSNINISNGQIQYCNNGGCGAWVPMWTVNYTCPLNGYSSNVFSNCATYCNTTTYSCPNGGTLSGTTCTYTATNTCPSGYSWNGSQCVASPSCPSGTSFNSSLEECISSATCPSGGSISGSQCVESPTYTCTYGGSYNGSDCVIAYTCPSNYSVGDQTCVAAATPVCPSGYTYNSSEQICTASAICPTDYTLSNSQCVAPINCQSGGSYNSSEGQCSTSVSSWSCPSGSLYSQADNFCYIAPTISFGETCPLGSYQCMPNGNGGYSCSTLTCSNVSTSTVTQVPTGNPNDKTNNGQVTDQGCNGNIYIFNGQTFDCRLPGIEDGFADCCSSAKDWLGLGKCWQNEVELQQKKSAGFCHYVGTYCTAKFLGICLQKDQAYCCFDGVLARIIQEQGRLQSLPQAGWGSAESPDCEGFTPTQFQALDWSKINLSEYYAYIEQTFMPNITNSVNNAVNNAANKLQQGYSGE